MLNKIMIIGNLGKDPEFREGENPICKFNVATSEKIKGEDKTEWHNVVAFGKVAEICNQYLKKGSKVFVEGKQTHRTYDDKDGNKKYYSEIILREIKFLSPAPKNEESAPSTPSENYSSAVPENDLPF
jgi:single-strand DNA-binding protein